MPRSKLIPLKKTLLIITLLLFAIPSLAADNKPVVMNTQTYIYHHPDCKWTKKCTKNCIKTTKQEAKTHGARACKVCGG